MDVLVGTSSNLIVDGGGGASSASRLGAAVGVSVVRRGCAASSGRIPSMGSSRVMRPRSTHWRAAMAVMILVQEPRTKVLSRVMGAASGRTDL
jgi:hypothetical protein